MLRVLLILVPLALAVYALVDCISTKDDEVKHLPKLVWILLIVLATVVGPLAWIFMGRERNRAGGAGGGGGWGGGRRGGGGGGWVAPDDNPEFLQSLDQGSRGRPEREPEAEPEADDKGDAAPEERDDREDREEDREGDVRRRDDGGGPDDTPPPTR
ncbi:PLD nuclease N-terminal domain-containing protein [Streptomyces sp. 6N223]|uniref:PLD nuclease N-terminal domain-containing protein n=1 Tax=Streptomyces sp. 6N223 TaxID=3457412 RepID=UPI003FD1435B